MIGRISDMPSLLKGHLTPNNPQVENWCPTSRLVYAHGTYKFIQATHTYKLKKILNVSVSTHTEHLQSTKADNMSTALVSHNCPKKTYSIPGDEE